MTEREKRNRSTTHSEKGFLNCLASNAMCICFHFRHLLLAFFSLLNVAENHHLHVVAKFLTGCVRVVSTGCFKIRICRVCVFFYIQGVLKLALVWYVFLNTCTYNFYDRVFQNLHIFRSRICF